MPKARAPLDLGGNKLTSVANGTGSGDGAAFGQLPSASSPLPVTKGGSGLSVPAPSGDMTGATDTAALQALINAVPSGSAITLSASAPYYISAALTVSKPLAFYGNASIIQVTANTTAVSVTSGGFTWDGPSLTGPQYAAYHASESAIVVKGASVGAPVSFIRIRDASISNWGAYGAYVQYASDVIVSGCSIWNIQYGGCAYLTVTGGQIADNRISNVAGSASNSGNCYGMSLSAGATLTTVDPVSANVTITGNTVTGVPWTGIDTHGGVNLTISGNHVQECYFGIALVGMHNGSGTQTSGVHRVKVTGNVVDIGGLGNGQGCYGIVVQGAINGATVADYASGVSVTGNEVTGYGVPGLVNTGGITATATQGLVVSGNTVENSGPFGINLYEYNAAFNIGPNTITDVWSLTANASAIFLASGNNTGTITAQSVYAPGTVKAQAVIASSSAGQAVSSLTTLTVAPPFSTANTAGTGAFAASGTVTVPTTTGTATLAYTGTTASTLTGVTLTSGTGNIVAGFVSQTPANLNTYGLFNDNAANSVAWYRGHCESATEIRDTFGAVTFPAASVAGDIGGTAASPQVVSTHLTAALPIGQGGTGTGTGAPQNQVFAGPATGGTGAPSFRALATTDVPTLNQNTTGTAANLSGTPALPTGTTAATQTTGDSTTKIATDAFVATAVAAETTRAQGAETLLAPKASPALTGTPTAPTAAALTGTTQVATTAYADSAAGAEKTRALAAEALLAPLASPALTGSPTAPTQTAGDATTKIATDQFVGTAVAALPATVGTWTADQYFKSGRPWFDVRAFGATGNGTTDDTAAFSAAILAAVGGNLTPATSTRTALGPVWIPAGTYKITSDLLIQSVSGFRLLGAGANCATLKASGTGFTTAVVNIDGSLDGAFEGFQVNGDGTEGAGAGPVPSAVNLTWTTGAQRSTSANAFRNIRVRNLNFTAGLTQAAPAGTTRQVDGSYLADIVIGGGQTVGSWSNTGAWQQGFVFGNGTFGNQYDYSLYNCSAGGCYYGYYCPAGGGFNLYGAQPGGNYCDFYISSPGGQVAVQGIQSQVAQMFLQGSGGSGVIPVAFRDVIFKGWTSSAPPSDQWITINGGGASWEFSNIDAGYFGGAGGYVPAIKVNGQGPGAAVTFVNLTQPSSPSSGFAASSDARLILVNYIQANATAATVNTIYPLEYWNGTAWSDLTVGTAAPAVQWVTATGSYTWAKPSGAQTADVLLLGGGGGGGSGAVETAGNAGGGGGGSGGAMTFRSFVASDLPSSVTGSVGAGGAGGTAASGTSAASGNAGSTGGSTSFSTFLDAYPGSGGGAGTSAAGAGGSGSSTTQGGGYAASPGGAGGAAGAGVVSSPAAGASGGGGGGGANTGSAFNGGASGYSTSGSTSNTGAGGVAGGASPGTGTQPVVKGTPSCGGGGGAGATGAGPTAQNGAAAFNGAGGGGGGGAFIASGTGTSGAGGIGGNGFALIITHFA